MQNSHFATLLAGTLALVATAGDLQATHRPPPSTCANAPAWHIGAHYRRGDRVIGDRGNLWQCKGGWATHLCDDSGYEPDVDVNAADAWELVETCFSADGPELATTDLIVSQTQCSSQITLTAVIENNSPFGANIPVAFYHSTNKVLIGVIQVAIPPWGDDPSITQVNMVWNDPTPGSALVTVVADDDGTGHGKVAEAEERDNTLSATLATCP